MPTQLQENPHDIHNSIGHILCYMHTHSNSFFIFPKRTILEPWKSTPTMSSSITGWFWLIQTMHSLQTNHKICKDSARVQTQYDWARLRSSVQSRGTCTYFCNSTSQKECSNLKSCHAYMASKYITSYLFEC